MLKSSAITVLLITCFASLNAPWQTSGTVTTEKQAVTTAENEAAKNAPRLFLTRRKSWLSSGGFNPNSDAKAPAPDFAKDFHKHCPKPVITDMQGTADFAVTIDEIGFVDSLARPDSPTFQVSVYSRGTGLLYTGGTNFLKNAIKDACNAIGAK
jgi:hypothetical protein